MIRIPQRRSQEPLDHQRLCLTTLLSTSLPASKKVRVYDGAATVSASKVRHAMALRRKGAMRPISRRTLLSSVTAFCGLGAARSAPALILNDASRLNPIPVAGHAIVRDSNDDRVVAELRALLQAAWEGRRP